MPQTDTFPTYLRRLKVAQKIQGKQRVPYKYIAKELGVAEITIKRDVHWIRQQVDLPSIQKLVAEKVLKALDNCDTKEDKEIILRTGLSFLGKGLTQKVEAHSIAEVHERKEIAIDISVLSDDEKSILDKAARILDRKSKRKPHSIH